MVAFATAVAGTVRRVARYAVGEGIEEAAIQRDVGLALSSLEVAERRIPIDRLFDLWAYTADRLHDVALPIRVAQHARLEDLHLIGFAVMSAPTLGDSLRTLVRHGALLTTSGNWEVRAGARGATAPSAWVEVRWHRSAPRTLGGRLSNETAVAQFVGGLRQLGGRGLDPLRVSFRHPRPASVAAHRDFFRCPVIFEDDHEGVTLPRDVLDATPPGANRGLWEYLCHEADARARTLAPRALSELVFDEIWRELARGEGSPSLPQVASALGTSERTLRRQLNAEQVTFRQLADRARRERTLELLRASGTSIADAAIGAGFSDTSALTHACARWFGETPRALRRGRG